MVDSVIVSVNFPDDDETSGIMIIGKKRIAHQAEIINVFKGKEARDLYSNLINRTDWGKKS